ncbi:MAG: alpha/beta hydrolase domain-containing protein [Pseudomonadota bacterium]
MRRLLCWSTIVALTSCASAGRGDAPAARLERFEIVSRTLAFDGAEFDPAGEYETIVAVAHLRINPRHLANRAIVDLALAPQTDGWVSYKADVIIVRPRLAQLASRVLLLDVPNRGAKLLLRMANEGSNVIDAAAGIGNAYTMRRGHTLVWIGWQGDIALAANGRLAGTAFPSLPFGGQVGTEAVFDDAAREGTIKLAYPAASLDQASAQLTVRADAGAVASALPASAWRFKGAREIELTRASGVDAGAIYRFDYAARDPKPMGLGMAALRDVASFLKSGAPDAAGQPNPLADIRPSVALAVGVSQSGRFLREWIWQGFNADPAGGKVFDGAMVLLAGAGKGAVNARFSQPEQAEPGERFPFSYAVSRDPASGASDGIFALCRQDDTCPKLMHVDSSVEFWQARAALVVTDGAGRDLALPDDVRAYLMASTQHIAAATPTVGVCRYPNNPAQQAPLVRALLERLVGWTRDASAPPPSRYPRMNEAMLTPAQRDAVGFPDLSALGVGFPAGLNELPGYQLLVPMADADGNDIAGVRLPEVAVPLATYGGWNLRRQGLAQGRLCGLNGLYLPFAASARAGDPRRAVAQRYGSRLEYAKAVALAARALRDQGLLLDEDVARYIERAKVEPRVAP